MSGSSDSAIAFGQRVLALLDTGSFTASYKYAVLLALIDAVLEGADRVGSPPAAVHATDVGRRVFAIYWRQARPFSARGALRQSAQHDVVAKIAEFRAAHGHPDSASPASARASDPLAFARLERDVVETVIRYPIPLLQKFGSGSGAVEQRFIYEYWWPDGVNASTIRRADFDDRLHLIEGAEEHLVALGGLLRPLVQREWLGFVARRNAADIEELRLEEFLFGSDRISLRTLREPLLDVQQGRCFYCQQPGRGGWEIDHFLPWSRWPDNQLDNLVLAHRACNNAKRAALPGLDHVGRWWPRFDAATSAARQIARLAVDTGWPRRADATRSAASALYLHQPEGTMLWVAPGAVEALDHGRLRTILLGGRRDLAAEDPGNFHT